MDKTNIKYKIILISTIISAITLTVLDLLVSKPIIHKKYPSLKHIEYSNLPGLEFKAQCCNYQLIDPLLGWALTDEQVKDKGFERRNNCFFLHSYNNSSSNDTLKIYLSGGSTTDLGYNPHNWPKILLDSLQKLPLNIELYVAAVSGYSTSQEFLKFMQDGVQILPDITISYNGANEILYPSYITVFEYAFYSRALYAEQSAFILPNTIFLIKEFLDLNRPIELSSPPDSSNYVKQWEKNMMAWNAVSQAYGTKFFGILQPVSKEKTGNQNIDFLVNKYPTFYNKAISIIPQHDFLIDNYRMLDSIGKEAFLDQCHVKDEYQYIVANSILNTISSHLVEKNKN